MSWLVVAIWGGLVGLDGTSFPQIMISRPLVAGTLTGAFLGRPIEGLAIGSLLEIFSFVILPIGAARYPESGTAAVAAAAAYGEAAGPGVEVHLILLAVVFALTWERIAGATVTALRRVNERLISQAPERGPMGAARLEWLHLTALGLDFARAASVVLAGAAVGLALLRGLGPFWSLGEYPVVGVLDVAGATLLGAAVNLFGGWNERRVAIALGIVCGSLLLLVR